MFSNCRSNFDILIAMIIHCCRMDVSTLYEAYFSEHYLDMCIL